jgi:hypothetical protein
VANSKAAAEGALPPPSGSQAALGPETSAAVSAVVGAMLSSAAEAAASEEGGEVGGRVQPPPTMAQILQGRNPHRDYITQCQVFASVFVI